MDKKRLRIPAFILSFIFVAVSIQLMCVNPHAATVNEPVAKSGTVETERKFLIEIENLPKNIEKLGKTYNIVQTYISHSPEMRVRMLNDKYYYFTLKQPLDDKGLSREEIELRITKEEYENLLTKREGSTIYKKRYQFHENGTYIFVDVYYSKKLKGLAVAEVEFPSVEESMKFTPPKWFGKDVTADKRYKNANLAKYGIPVDKE